MPKQQTKATKVPSGTSKQALKEKFAFEEDGDDNNTGSLHSSQNENETPIVPKGKKRQHSVTEDPESGDFGIEMQKMLECFGADISKTLINKRKRLEQFTQASLKTSNRKVGDIWKKQEEERQTLNSEYKKQVEVVFQQWEADLEKTKETEEKLQNLFKQQQKLFQQARVVQNQRLVTIKQLHEQYIKGMEGLENCHHNQQDSVQSELKKEMALLQKKILMDTQQQEMASVRKSLQTMLF